jgi:hypothetical protein
MRALSPPPVRGGGTMMIVITFVVLLLIALLMFAMFWRSAWLIENGPQGGSDVSPPRTEPIGRTANAFNEEER